MIKKDLTKMLVRPLGYLYFLDNDMNLYIFDEGKEPNMYDSSSRLPSLAVLKNGEHPVTYGGYATTRTVAEMGPWGQSENRERRKEWGILENVAKRATFDYNVPFPQPRSDDEIGRQYWSIVS